MTEPETLDARARAAWSKVDVETNEATKELAALTSEAPNRHDYWTAYAIALAKARRFADAIAAFERAVTVEPLAIDAWCNLGELAADDLRWDLAVKALGRCLALDPDGRHPSGVRARAIIKKLAKHVSAVA